MIGYHCEAGIFNDTMSKITRDHFEIHLKLVLERCFVMQSQNKFWLKRIAKH